MNTPTTVQREDIYNEDLCQQVREGKLAIENTDEEKIVQLIEHIWPRDSDPLVIIQMMGYKYFFAGYSLDWNCSNDETDRKSLPVSDFLALPTVPKEQPEDSSRTAMQMVQEMINDKKLDDEQIFGKIKRSLPSLFEKEKEQIIEAHNKGWHFSHVGDKPDGEQYFNNKHPNL